MVTPPRRVAGDLQYLNCSEHVAVDRGASSWSAASIARRTRSIDIAARTDGAVSTAAPRLRGRFKVGQISSLMDTLTLRPRCPYDSQPDRGWPASPCS
jgi:hypothetical protein